MTEVRRRAQPHADRAGDPLDGLVNMFDLGLVLAIAFLVAGIGLSAVLGKRSTKSAPASISISRNEQLVPLRPGLRRVPVTGSATSLGQVYRLANGELVYVVHRP